MAGRPNARFGASALLQKASAQLRGERPASQTKQTEDSDDDLDAYFSAMRKISTNHENNSNITDGKPNKNVPVSKFIKKQPATAVNPRQTSQTFARNSKARPSVLNKAASYDNKYTSSTKGYRKMDMSDSDMDLTLSMDEQVVADVQALKKNENASPPKESLGIFASLPSAARFAAKPVMDTDEESLADFIGDLSSSTHSSPRRMPAEHSPVHSQSRYSPAKTGDKPKSVIPTQPKSILKPPRTPSTMEFISEQEDQSSMVEESVDESQSSNDSYKVEVLDLESLEPAKNHHNHRALTSTNKSHSRKQPTSVKSFNKSKPPVVDDFYSSMGLQTVDDLLGNDFHNDEASEEDKPSARDSEIHTQIGSDYYESDFEPATGRRSTTPLRSILSPSPRPTPRSGRSRVRYSLDDVQEVPYRSPSPETIHSRQSSDYDETIRTETESVDEYTSFSERSASEKRSVYSRTRTSEDYSDDFTSASESQRSSRKYSRTMSVDSNASYSDDFSSFTDYTSDRSRSPSPDLKFKRNVRSREIQTGLDIGLQYSWDPCALAAASLPLYGLGTVDPTPIATHVVSADALESLTAYSPSVLALNDMLRQQLQLTSQFIHLQQSHHSRITSALEGIHDSPNTAYTTMNDYKQYVRKHKKPTITFDEAIKQVKYEMGMV